MRDGQNVILLSPRRYGKTSVLSAAIEQVRRGGGRSGYASLAQCTDRRDVAAELLRAALNGPLSWLASRTAELGRLLARFRVRPEVTASGEGTLQVRFGSGIAEQTSTEMIGEVLRLLGHPPPAVTRSAWSSTSSSRSRRYPASMPASSSGWPTS